MQKKIFVLFRPFDTTKMFSHFLVFFSGFFNPKNRGVKKWGRNGRKSTKIFFCIFWVQILLFFSRLSHQKPISIKMAHSLLNFHQFLSNFIPPKFFIYFQSFFSAFFYLFFFLVKFKSRGVKKRGNSGRNVTKIFFLLFWVPFVIIVLLKSPGTHLKQNGKRFFNTRQK